MPNTVSSMLWTGSGGRFRAGQSPHGVTSTDVPWTLDVFESGTWMSLEPGSTRPYRLEPDAPKDVVFERTPPGAAWPGIDGTWRSGADSWGIAVQAAEGLLGAWEPAAVWVPIE